MQIDVEKEEGCVDCPFLTMSISHSGQPWMCMAANQCMDDQLKPIQEGDKWTLNDPVPAWCPLPVTVSMEK